MPNIQEFCDSLKTDSLQEQRLCQQLQRNCSRQKATPAKKKIHMQLETASRQILTWSKHCGISANISKAVNATDAAAAHNQLLSQATTHNTQYYQKHYTDYPASHKQDDNPADCGVWTDGNANATASHVPFGIMRMQPSHLECIALEMAKELQTLRTTCGILQATVLQQQDEIETLRLEVQLLQDQGELLRDW